MNIETKHQQQQQQKRQKQYQQQQQSQHQHHAHCSYDTDIVCDDAQMHKQKHQHHSHQPHPQSHQQCELSKINDNMQQHQQQQPYQHRSKQQDSQQQTSSFSHRHQHQHQSQSQQSQSQTQRSYSHSHSPHHSRHTSPHSHHSHSLHTSPHQSHQHVNGSTGGGSGGIDTVSYHSPTATNYHSSTSQRPLTQSTSTQHAHHHHHHHRRRSRRNHSHNSNGNGGNGNGSGGGSGNSSLHGPHGHSHNTQDRSGSSRQHTSSCSRRHRSATDVSSVSLNTCNNENCIDREVQEIFVRKSCCSSSRTELAQYFAEDLYGSSRRPSSCCTSSDYCYQTDSTSLYGSRSTLSRNNSIKSASISMRKRRALHQRQPSYTSISLRGIQSSQPSSRQQQLGSLTTVFDRKKSKSTDLKHSGGGGGGRVVLSPSKVTIERQTSKDLSQELPDYACSPSPIRWSFLADDKTQTEMDTWKIDTETERSKTSQPRKPCRKSKPDSQALTLTKDGERSSTTKTTATTTPRTARKRRESAFSCEFEESSTTVLFHQEGEAFNNCCNNYIQCNTYLDQDLQITSEDIHQYLSKGNQSGGDILNNSKNYPFQPSNALEFHYKNNFANNNANDTGNGNGTGTNTTAESSEGAESVLAANGVRTNINHYRRNSSKETNLNQNFSDVSSVGACGINHPANINLSSSTNNINIIFNNNSSTATSMSTNAAGIARNANEVKFINNTASRSVVTTTTKSNENRRSDYMSSTTYDCSNMSSNSYFDKKLGIDELPIEFETNASGGGGGVTKPNTTTPLRTECSEAEGSSTDGQHSSPLPSPVRTRVSFESFDAPSDHNLISQRGSCQFSSPTPRSPLSPSSPACSSLSNSVNPSAPSTYVVEPLQHHHQQQHSSHHYYSYEPEHQQTQSSSSHGHHYHHRHQPHASSTSPGASTSQSQQRNNASHHTQSSSSGRGVGGVGGHNHHQRADDDYYRHHQHHHHHNHHHNNSTNNDSFKLSNAFKKVRKRARKYTEFLRKK